MAATYSSLVGLAVGGKYEIRRVLGIGGMGVVCEAMNVDLQKRVALKLIDKTMKESELIVERFRREARAAGRIQSEHIVDVFDIGADARVGLYMVMEHLAGEDLQPRLERDGRLDVNTAVMVGHQIARGLAKAHAAGVIHRDLKPANVFLTSRDNGQLLVKLLDFGVSKLLVDQGSARITGTGAPIGTPLYMSPEQAEGRMDTDGRADIWSLGAVMYEALSGEPPFQDRGSYHGTIVGILTSRPKMLKSAAPWVPAEICAVVDAMLVHDRDARIRDADTVTKRLLEAYPAVLPDGTGRHTAVIVSQAAAAIDATGETEIFTATGFRVSGESPSRPPGVSSGNNSALSSGQAAALLTSQAAAIASSPPATDSHKTVPEPPKSNEELPSDTGVATKVRLSDPGEEAAPVAVRSHSGITTRPYNAPVVNPTPSSSAGGVAMPATPPVIDPLPRAPDTERDVQLAHRAERRRYIAFAAILATLVAFSFGGFYLGRHASQRNEMPPPPSATPAVATTVPAATAPVEPPAATTEPETARAAPKPSSEASVLSPAQLPEAASAKPKPAPRKAAPRKPPAAPASAAATTAPEPTPAPEPAPAPEPTPESP